MNFLFPFFNSLPGALGQGLAWGIMAIGVYITYRILDVSDLTVDGSLATGGAVCAVGISLGVNPWLALLLAVVAGMLAGLVTGLLHTKCGIPAILSGILTQLALYSLNLRIMAIGTDSTTRATVALNVDTHNLLLSSRYVRELGLNNPLLLLAIVAGMLSGLVTGLLHTKCGIPAILSGILTQLALYSLNLRIMAIGTDSTTRATVALSVDNHNLLLSSRFIRSLSLENPLILLVLGVGLVIGALYWFFGTEMGCSLRATGANTNMARAQGINTNFAKVLALVVSNGLVALSGALLAQYQGSATIDMGRGAIVIGLAAVIIGEVLFS